MYDFIADLGECINNHNNNLLGNMYYFLCAIVFKLW